MKTRELKSLIGSIFVLGSIGLFAYYSFKNSNDKMAYLRSNGIEGKGKIHLDGSSIVCTYSVNGQFYQQKFGRPFTLEQGEVYKIRYDANKPTDFIVLYEYPLFEADSLYQTTYTSYVDFSSDNNFIKFRYKINQQEYERFQKLPENINIKERYLVKFMIANKKIAYIVW